jgi:predicted transcriptional regulator of viral defense system
VVCLDRDEAIFAAFPAKPRRQALARLEGGGWLHRLERGAYLVLGPSGLDLRPTLAVVADWLEGTPYAVGGTAALAHWNLSGHTPSVVDILTSRRKRAVDYRGLRFVFHATERKVLDDPSSVRRVRIEGARAPLQVVGPERAVLATAYGQHASPLAVTADAFDRGLRFGVFNRRRFVAQARHDYAAARRIGWLAEKHHDPLAQALAPLVGRGGFVPLDPRGTAEAPLNQRWRVIENAQYEDVLQ